MVFNPHEHMLQLKSSKGTSDYLPVQFRLVWFRELCPDGTIDTEEVVVDLDQEVTVEVSQWNNETRRSEKVQKTARGYARFRAIVTDGKGARATATGSESAVDFSDFTEKAETKAVGRALAMLGYGTQFAPEFDEQHRIVDAPVENRSRPAHQSQHSQGHQPAAAKSTQPVQSTSATEPIDEAPATTEQMGKLRALYEQLGMQIPARSLTFAQAKSATVKLEARIREKQAKYQSMDEISAELAAQKSA